MKRLIVVAACALTMSLGLSACGSQSDASGGSLTLTLAGTETPDHPITPAMEQFKKDVESATDGRVKITLQLNGVLGGEDAMADSLQRGTIDMGVLSDLGLASIEPAINVIGLPYLLPDLDSVDKYYHQGFLGEFVAKKLEAKDIRVLGWMDNGFRALSNSKRPVKTAADVKGLRMRVVQNDALIDYFDRLGATVTPMPITELLTALQQGVVDGQENGISLTTTFGFGDVQKYMTLTNHAYSAVPLTINEDSWKKVSSADQDAILVAAKTAFETARANYVKEEQSGRKKLEQQDVKFTELTPEALAEFKKVAQATWEKLASDFDADVMKQIDSELGGQ